MPVVKVFVIILATLTFAGLVCFNPIVWLLPSM